MMVDILNFIKEKAESEQQQMAVRNCVAIFVTGSHLYGTNTPTSDFDYEGLFFEDPEYVLGTKRCEEVNFSTNKDNTRNTPEDVDCI
jgi:predicted nucleotidyltransferase